MCNNERRNLHDEQNVRNVVCTIFLKKCMNVVISDYSCQEIRKIEAKTEFYYN